MYHKIVNSQT